MLVVVCVDLFYVYGNGGIMVGWDIWVEVVFDLVVEIV